MSGLGAAALLALKIYLLAIVISMAMAVLIRVVEMATAAGGAARRSRPRPREDRDVPAPLDENIAVIAAAVHATLGAHRIVHIEERGSGRAWSTSGRSAHHGSHNVSRHGPRSAPPPQHKP